MKNNFNQNKQRGSAAALKSIFLLFFVILAFSILYGQSDILNKLEKIRIPGLEDLLRKKPAINTDLSDAVTEVPFLDDFNPRYFTSLTVLPRGSNGEFILKSPGLYEEKLASYCLHAGTYGPSEGDGYLYAPLKGSQADIISNILRRAYRHPEISQNDIQLLIWAIQAHANIKEMSPEMQATASVLLTKKEIFNINGGALGLIPEELMQMALEKLPDQLRSVMEAEARIRALLSGMQGTYEDIEQIAVLVGDHALGEGSRQVPASRWSYHPEGFFIRFFASHYQETQVQIYRPELFQVQKDPQGRIASIDDGNGNRIEIEYDNSIKPLAIIGEPGLKGHAFRSVYFVNREILFSKLAVNSAFKWENTGYTLTGVPTGKGKNSTGLNRFTGLAQRCQLALDHKKQIEILDKQFTPKGNLEEIMDLSHVAIGLKEVIDNSSDSPDWAGDHIGLVKKAWQYNVCSREGGINTPTPTSTPTPTPTPTPTSTPTPAPTPIPAHTPTYDPSACTAVPLNTLKQILGLSPIPTTRPDCQAIKDEIRFQKAMQDAYANKQILEHAQKYKYTKEQYEMEVYKNATGKDPVSADDGAYMGFDIKSGEIVYPDYDENGNIRRDGNGRIMWSSSDNAKTICMIKMILKYGGEIGAIIYDAAQKHEGWHKNQWKLDSDKLKTLNGLSASEVGAYQISIDALSTALDNLKCPK
ncbi:MAG: hypothetical protein QG657_4667 [Acidobacteriota bacterium]|nr:hypothetical protein [Acidobacteriota bacterium]